MLSEICIFKLLLYPSYSRQYQSISIIILFLNNKTFASVKIKQTFNRKKMADAKKKMACLWPTIVFIPDKGITDATTDK